ncbi:MAG: hypothetical protein K6T83_08155 [Alicyclobacillus sp.]|nr:hypothetical protein [Alicyclobacillus sp.]
MDVQVVYERSEDFDSHVGPYGHEKVGLRIEDRVIWLATEVWPSGGNWEKVHAEYKKWKAIAQEIECRLRGPEERSE